MADSVRTEVLRILIRAENLASKQLAAVGAEAELAGSRVGRMAQGLKLGVGAMGVAGAGVGLALASSVDKAMQFEKTMSGVGAVSGATGAQLQQLSDLALQLGKDTTFSASEAAQALEELVKGGVGIPDIMNGAAKATLNLAAAGGVALPDAAEIASNALAMFSLNGKDMAHVADLIAGAANASSISVMDFKFSLASAGATASTMGFKFDDLAVAIAELGKNGIKGSMAGTTLKSMFLRLEPTTDKAQAMMEKLGIITFNTSGAMRVLAEHGIHPLSTSHIMLEAQLKTLAKSMLAPGASAKEVQGAYADLIASNHIMQNSFFDASGKVKGMADVSQVLQNAMKGLSEQQQITAMHVIFGTYAINAAGVLARDGAKGFNDMAAAMGKVTAADVAAKRMNNLAGNMEQLRGSVETLQIEIGMALIPTLTQLVKYTTGVVNSILTWTSAHPALTKTIVLTTAALAALSVGIAVVTFAIMPAISMIAALSTPLLVIAAAAAVLYEAWTNDWGGIREITASVWAWLQRAFAGMLDAVHRVRAAFGKGGLGAAVAELGDLLNSGLERVGAFVVETVNKLADALPGIAAQLGKWGGEFLRWIAPRIGPMALELGKLYIRMELWFLQTLGKINLQLAKWGWAFVQWVVPMISRLIGALEDLDGKLMTWVGGEAKKLAGKFYDLGKSASSGLVNGLKSVPVLGTGVSIVDGLYHAAADKLKSHSPSRLFFDLGMNTTQGFIDGINAQSGALNAAMATQAGHAAEHWVRGYTTKNGVLVHGHWAHNPGTLHGALGATGSAQAGIGGTAAGGSAGIGGGVMAAAMAARLLMFNLNNKRMGIVTDAALSMPPPASASAPLASAGLAAGGSGAGAVAGGGPVYTITVNVQPGAVRVEGTDQGGLGQEIGEAVAASIRAITESQRRSVIGARQTTPGVR